MANYLSPDDFDFAAYEAMTEHSQKVRPAGDFFEGVRRAFTREASGKRHPSMTSTKLGKYLDFPPGSVTVWAGFNGHRKSIMTGQVSLDLCAQGERTLLASMEMKPDETLMRMARQASATNRPADEWLDQFELWTNQKLWLFDHLGKVTPHQILGVLRYFANELGGKQAVVDSLMKCVDSEESLDQTKSFMTDITKLALDTGLHIHLVAHCKKPGSAGETLPPTKYDIKGSGSISDQAANVVLVWINKAKLEALEKDANDEEAQKKPDAMVIVDKQRHKGWEGKLALWFDNRSMRFCDNRMEPVQAYDLQEMLE